VAFRLPAVVIERIDQWALERGVSRSHFFRVLLEEGEQALRRKKRRAEARNAAIVAAVLANPPQSDPEPASVVTNVHRSRRRMTPEEVRAAADRAERPRR
jgi:hypothetical protein